VREFWKKLKSIKLAIGLIAVIAVGSLLATLVPQGKAAEEYFKIFPKILAELIVQTGLSRYFSSILFLIPVFLFFINLGACTIDRLLRELKKKGRRRHGPDILHVGLLILIVGGLVSFSGRKEGTVRLKAGDAVELPGGEVLKLIRFTDERYDDGRPKDWTSVVTIEKEGKAIKPETEIRVNRPLRVGSLTIYQASYVSEMELVFIGPSGSETHLAKGDTFEDGPLSAFFMTVEGENTALLMVKGSSRDGLLRVGAEGARVGDFDVALGKVLSTGLQAVRDPGYPFVLLALVLVGLGTALTFYQKLKDMES